MALVLGLAGQQFGFSIFPNSASHIRFRDRSRQRPQVLSAGGAKRRSFHPKNVVSQTLVAVAATGGGGGEEYAEEFDFDTLDPDGLLGANDWSGPPDTWPAASATLMAFGAPLELDGAPLEVADVMYRLLSLIWNAVVAADFMGLPEKVEMVRTLALPLPIPDAVDKFIARKRRSFPRDNRVLSISHVTKSREELRVGVDWSFGTPME